MAQTVRSRIEAAAKLLRKHKQEHVLSFVDDLTQKQKILLLKDIESLDWNLIDALIETCVLCEPCVKLTGDIQPPPVYPARPDEKQEPLYAMARDMGERLIASNKVAAFTVAGGMGTRLNFNGPKGCVPATCLRNKPLFQVFAEGIIANERYYNSTIPWYIMTSPANHDATIAAFKANDYYGLKPENVFFFPQGMMPCFDLSGKVLLAEKYRLAMSPDGHGGSLRALYNSGALDDMAHRGIEYISYFQVDNPLVYVIDPLFIGLHAMDGAEMSSKAVLKNNPLEKVGNFVLADGRITVIEYSDLPEELARKTDENGKLVFEWGSIAIHVLSRTFVERINSKGFSLPWHRANKVVPHLDENGKLITSDKPNAVKLETFVFDALPLADKSIILEIDRNEQFAPIKNASGVDSLQTSQQLQLERACRWMAYAGIEVPRKPDGSPDVILEISPLFALNPDELKRKRAQLRPLKSKDIAYLG